MKYVRTGWYNINTKFKSDQHGKTSRIWKLYKYTNFIEKQANSIINTLAAISCVFLTKYRHCGVEGYIKSIFCHIQSKSAETWQLFQQQNC